MEFVGQHKESVKLLGLTAPLVPGPGGAEPGRLEAEVQRLESVLNATTETASDIVSVLRCHIFFFYNQLLGLDF